MINPNRTFKFECAEGPEGVRGKFVCPEDLPYLEGHFPGQPVLPAVAIIDATCVFLSQICPDFIVVKVDSAKFSGPVQPGMLIDLRAIPSVGTWTVTWTHGEHTLAELRLVSA